LTSYSIFLPKQMVQMIGNSSFRNLQERGAVKTWIVGYFKESNNAQIADENNEIIENDITVVEYLDLRIEVSPNKLGWFYQVYDPRTIEILQCGNLETESKAIESAKKWIYWYQFESHNLD
jgi:hypothetical protein